MNYLTGVLMLLLKNRLNLADVAKQSAKGSIILMLGQVL